MLSALYMINFNHCVGRLAFKEELAKGVNDSPLIVCILEEESLQMLKKGLRSSISEEFFMQRVSCEWHRKLLIAAKTTKKNLFEILITKFI